MSIFQLLASVFALFMLYIVSIHKKKSRLPLMEVLFWYSTWIVFILVALFPQSLSGVVEALHFARVFDLLTVIALMIITMIVILNYFAQKENSRKLEEFVRKEAIQKTLRNKKA